MGGDFFKDVFLDFLDGSHLALDVDLFFQEVFVVLLYGHLLFNDFELHLGFFP